jgi:hypothetical protein
MREEGFLCHVAEGEKGLLIKQKLNEWPGVRYTPPTSTARCRILKGHRQGQAED